MTKAEIKKAGFRLIEQTAIAMMNVFNGCASDRKIVADNMARLPKMVEWFKENDLMPELKYFMSLPKWNLSSLYFHMSELNSIIMNY